VSTHGIVWPALRGGRAPAEPAPRPPLPARAAPAASARRSIQKGRKPNVSVAAHLLSSIVYNNKDKLSAGLIVAGVDDKAGPQVYAIPLGGTLVRQPLAVGGSGSVFIHSLGDDQYDPRMTGDDAQAFAKKMVSHAMSRDGSSGGVIRTVVMDADGAKRSFWSGADLPFTIEGGTDDLAAALAEARHEGASAAAAASSSSSAAAAVRT